MLQPKFSNLHLNTACELLCADCPHWQDNAPLGLKQIRPREWLVNLTGGNPLNHPDLGKILIRLKQAGHFTALTTCGYRLESLEQKFLPLIDLFFLYVPSCDREISLLKTGLNAWNQQKNAIAYLQEIRKNFIVLHPVDQDNLEYLPDLFGLLNKKNSGLILLHQKRTANSLTRPQKSHLYYYGSRPNVLVYEYKQTAPAGCADFLQQLNRLSFYNLLTLAKLFYKFAFLR